MGIDTMPSSKALYLYCFVSDPVKTDPIMGIDGHHPVFTRGGDSGITAILSEVMLKEFVGPIAEQNMKDVAWVTPRACRHQEVIEQIDRQTDVFPARFGTIFSTDDILEKLIFQHRKKIRDFMDSVHGHAEWSFKGFLDREKVVGELCKSALSEEEERLKRLTTGVRYFEEKKIKAAAAKQLNHWLHKKLTGVMNDLNTMTTRRCSRDLLSRKATGEKTDMVFNEAFLIADESVDAFCQKTDEFNRASAQTGLIFQRSGPWPPYSFCPSLTIDQDEVAG